MEKRGPKPPFLNHPSLIRPSPSSRIRFQSSAVQIFIDRSFSILVYSQKFMANFGPCCKKTLAIAGGGFSPKNGINWAKGWHVFLLTQLKKEGGWL
jgi:hypothetical protein